VAAAARRRRSHTAAAAFFDAEEAGLQGAQAFVKAPPVPAGRLALNVNFDMVSRSATREIFVAGPGRWPALLPILQPAAAKSPVTVRFGHDTGGGQNDWTTQSDHGAFHAAGIPFVYVGVEDHPDYHQPTDTADKIAPDFLGGVTVAPHYRRPDRVHLGRSGRCHVRPAAAALATLAPAPTSPTTAPIRALDARSDLDGAAIRRACGSEVVAFTRRARSAACRACCRRWTPCSL
jgi:hypothetical protein